MDIIAYGVRCRFSNGPAYAFVFSVKNPSAEQVTCLSICCDQLCMVDINNNKPKTCAFIIIIILIMDNLVRIQGHVYR